LKKKITKTTMAPNLTKISQKSSTPYGTVIFLVLLVFATLGGVGFYVYKRRPSFYNPFYNRRNSQYTELLGEIHI